MAELKRTLLSQHIEGKDDKLLLSKNPENNIEVYFKQRSKQPVCMIVYTTTGIFYYDYKTEKNKIKAAAKNKAIHKDVKWSF